MNIEKLKQKILDLAIRGQLFPQDPSDESAKKLIKRIKEEKEKLVKEGKIKPTKNESYIFKGSDNSYYEKIGTLIQSVSTISKEVKTRKILKKGKYPVISQSSNFVDGYCNDESKLIRVKPVILFGDHTKIVKFIEMDFVPGADGTKLYTTKHYPKYIYYLVLFASMMIDDKGYARHNSYLKNYEITFFDDLNMQIAITLIIDDILDKIKKIENDYDAIKVFVNKIKNKILDSIFGEYSSYKSYYNQYKLKDISQITMGQSPNGNDIITEKRENALEFHQGKIAFGSFHIENSRKYAIRYNKKAAPNSLLICVRAPVGDLNITTREIAIGRGLCAIKPRDNINIKYIYYYLVFMKKYFIDKSSGSTFQAITVNTLKECNVLLPEFNVQNEIVNLIDKYYNALDSII